MNIALVSCLELPDIEYDEDEAPLLAALRARGHHAQTIHWDNPAHDPAAYDACVLRATWNYHWRLPAFKAWLEHAAARTRLLNPLPTVNWNLHKKYLCELESRRISIVPTAWADHASTTDLANLCEKKRWTKIVIKPAVSGGSRETRVFELPAQTAEAQAFLDRSAAREDTMIQRYMPSVEHGGEVSIICMAGQISHAIEKRPRFAGQDESIQPHPEITEAERRFAMAVLDACPLPTTYARVDLIKGDQGEILLSELELIEPSLFFNFAPGSADRFAQVIEAAVSRVDASS